MQSQKHLFQLPEDFHYLNAAYMSPLLRSVEEAGIVGIARKRNPAAINPNAFTEEADAAKALFAELIHCPPAQLAIIPAVSYGIMTAISNLPTDKGNKAIVVAEEFPSGYYAIKRWCDEQGKTLETITPTLSSHGRGKAWNEAVLAAITPETTAVLLSSVHWIDGTRFDLAAIGQRCRECGALFIVDGTQSVGAIPMDVAAFGIDVLVCAAYKWLLGPYSIGFAYYSEAFNEGRPLEIPWINMSNANSPGNIADYVADFLPAAARYNVGQYSNFILLPMLEASLRQIKAWGVPEIQLYCAKLIQPLETAMSDLGFWMESPDWRCNHIFGIYPPAHLNPSILADYLRKKNISVSLRGKCLRISPHLYNDQHDISALIQALAGAF